MKRESNSGPELEQIQPKLDVPARRVAGRPSVLACWQAECKTHGAVVAYEQFYGGKPVYICTLCMIEYASLCFGTSAELGAFGDRVAELARVIKPVGWDHKDGRVVQQ